jgi:hypothetical protein
MELSSFVSVTKATLQLLFLSQGLAVNLVVIPDFTCLVGCLFLIVNDILFLVLIVALQVVF